MTAIINYGIGNLTSILNMHNRLGIDAVITNSVLEIERADKLLIPGVGHFDTCMKSFNAGGLRMVVEKRISEDKIPVLGICVGAQMMTRRSEEGNEKGLGWVNAETVRFRFSENIDLKIPHIGWTDLQIEKPSPLWNDLPEHSRFYFAHSYHFVFDNDSMVTGSSVYGYHFACAFRDNNIFGLQFHPEKSHRFGMKVLKNFASYNQNQTCIG